MKSFHAVILLLSLVLTGLAAPETAAQVTSFRGFFAGEDQPILFDYATFNAAEAGKVRLEVYHKVYNHALNFLQKGDQYVADYELTITVTPKKEGELQSVTRNLLVRVKNKAATQSRTDFRINQANFILDPGDYKLDFILRDRASNEVDRLSKDIDADLYDSRKGNLSSIELVHQIQRTGETKLDFDKGQYTMIPSVTGEFAGEEGGQLMFYLEAYPGSDPDDNETIETLLRSHNKGMVYRDSLTLDESTPVNRQYREISIENFPPGDYTLEITLRGHRGRRLDQEKKDFSIIWSTKGMLTQEYEKALHQLAYIARPGEIEKMKDLKTTKERIEAFNEFWRSRDPTPTTPENEVKMAFYYRVHVANKNFGYMRQDGWATDRGRIYIQYGEPDQIDDVPVAINSVPYQSWHYYRQGVYRKFTFVDVNEDGDYRLQYPYDGLGQRPDF